MLHIYYLYISDTLQFYFSDTLSRPQHDADIGRIIDVTFCVKKHITLLDDVSFAIYHTCVCYKIVWVWSRHFILLAFVREHSINGHRALYI